MDDSAARCGSVTKRDFEALSPRFAECPPVTGIVAASLGSLNYWPFLRFRCHDLTEAAVQAAIRAEIKENQ